MSFWKLKKYKYLARMLWQKFVFRLKIFLRNLSR